MRNYYVNCSILCALSFILFTRCTHKSTEDQSVKPGMAKNEFNGYKSQVEWGAHLVKIVGCGDCHTPKKMTANGPADDSTLLLSGHPGKMPAPDVNRREIETKGLAVTTTSTVWIGPWGISYASNLTSDETGIGTWQESNFITALREGKFKGIPSSRELLPPMPWQWFRNMSDDELKAIFAFLKATKPVHNVVPLAQPPLLAGN